MGCPECGDRKFKDICPRCRAQVESTQQESIQVGFNAQHPVSNASKRQPWHSELKRRVNEHYEKKQKPDEDIQEKHLSNPLAKKLLESSAERPLFDYRLENSSLESSHREKVPSRKKSRIATIATKKTLIRTSLKPRENFQSRLPQQRKLILHGAVVGVENPVITQEKKAAERPAEVSREIIFSRILAGIVDLVLPFFLAIFFILIASMILNFDLLAPVSIKIGGVFSFCFYFFNSFFFLVLSGQTPGMYLTDLQLVGENSTEFNIQSVFLRVTLFLPVSCTVVGLIWSIFDPWCRCLHDRLSRTRVVPLED